MGYTILNIIRGRQNGILELINAMSIMLGIVNNVKMDSFFQNSEPTTAE